MHRTSLPAPPRICPIPAPKAIEWVGGVAGHLRLLDQTRLPAEIAYRDCRDLESVREAILCLAVRGAPAIGVSAAYGLVLWMQAHRTRDGFSAAVEPTKL